MSASALAGAAALPSSLFAAGDPRWAPYRNAFVVDACGAVGGGESLNAKHRLLDDKEIADAQRSGVTLVNFTVGSVASYADDYRKTLDNISFWDHEFEKRPDVLQKITSGAQLADLKKSGRIGIVYGFQDTTMYGENLDRFDLFHNFGVRPADLQPPQSHGRWLPRIR